MVPKALSASVWVAVCAVLGAWSCYHFLPHLPLPLPLPLPLSLPFPFAFPFPLSLPFLSHLTQTPQGCDSSNGTCELPPVTVELYSNGYIRGGKNITLSQSDCESVADIGQLLSPHLGCTSSSSTGDKAGFCRVFTEVATLITSCTDLQQGQKLFLVPHNRQFVWPTHYPGYSVEINHVKVPNNRPIRIESIAEEPKVFRLHNFFTEEEADELMAHALSITDEEHKLKRSSTGTNGYNIDSQRTSENAFDNGSPAAAELKKRCFELLGIFPYDETLADGLQILRYNVSKGYNPHLDYFDVVSGTDHDYDSAAEGTNRFATILLYMTDVEEGGETVFPKSPPSLQHPYPEYVGMNRHDVMSRLQSEGKVDHLPEGGWERNMLYDCRTKLSVKPQRATAILFYSQLPDGRLDDFSLHGACPIIKGQKWAANLWVWNGRRARYSTTKEGAVTEPPLVKSASFETLDVEGAELYYEDSKWGDLTHGQVFNVNTYEGHRWFVRKDGATVLQWTVTDEPSQKFVLRHADLDPQL